MLGRVGEKLWLATLDHSHLFRTCSCSLCSTPTTVPLESNIIKRVLLVPWSIAPTYFMKVCLKSVGGDVEEDEQKGPLRSEGG